MTNSLIYPAVIQKDAIYSAIADLSKRLANVDTTLLMHQFIDFVPDEHLYLLAEKWSVTGWDGWSLCETVEQKRELIKNAYQLHKYKGTPYAIRYVCRVLGLCEIEIIEGLSDIKYDAKYQHNGQFFYGEPAKWAHYQVILNKPITNAFATKVRAMLDQFAPARCVLDALSYETTNYLYNSIIDYSGQYNHGVS